MADHRIFIHVPHPRILARKAAGPVKVADQLPFSPGDGRVKRFNARLGLRITTVVGTMWCAYAFTLIALTSLPTTLGLHSVNADVQWVAQTFLQLVLLSVIIVGQNVQAKAADKRSEQTYLDAEAVLAEALAIQEHLQAQDSILAQLITAREVPGGGR